VILVGLWILTTFCWKTSNAQLNPAVTLAYMLRLDSKRLSIPLGLLIMAAQVLGAYIGALYSAFIDWQVVAMEPVRNSLWFAAMMQETIGTFVFVIFYMIVTDERLYFSKESIINCLIIASSYVAARSIVEGSGSISTFGACLNPAVAVGISLVSLLSDPGSTFAWFWIYYFMPLAGSLIAVVFFRLVYLKTQLMIEKDSEKEDNLDDIK
jgi:hypothetical protein